MALTTFSGPVRSLNGFITGSGATVTELSAATASLNFGSIATLAQADLTITVAGAAVGDYVVIVVACCPYCWHRVQRIRFGCRHSYCARNQRNCWFR